MDRHDFLKRTGLALGDWSILASSGTGTVAKADFAFRRNHLPGRGLYGLQPATQWEEALVAGNGTLGILVYGDPFRERIIFNHKRLYEPLRDERVPPPNLAPHLPHIRTLMQAGRYREAIAYSL